jgi:hypothetical protein
MSRAKRKRANRARIKANNTRARLDHQARQAQRRQETLNEALDLMPLAMLFLRHRGLGFGIAEAIDRRRTLDVIDTEGVEIVEPKLPGRSPDAPVEETAAREDEAERGENGDRDRSA